MAIAQKNRIALWVLTPNGLNIARRLKERWPTAALFCSKRLVDRNTDDGAHTFHRLTDTVARQFDYFQGHIFIMATGIVVRSIAPLLCHKSVDPGVVVVDDRGRFAISLTAGHLGGANAMARFTAECLGATPVITTATDINAKPAIDLLASEHGLKIDNPTCIKAVNMALLTDKAVRLHDPDSWLVNCIPNAAAFGTDHPAQEYPGGTSSPVGVWIGDTLCDLPPDILVLRPPTLVAGIGCNRNTDVAEIRDLLLETLHRFSLASGSLTAMASIDLKSDERGLLDLAADLGLGLHFFGKRELGRVKNVPTPSTTVAKHVGVHSVCEAAAILASRHGRLIVPKHNTKNVTVAIARMASTSSASAPETLPTSPNGQGRS